MDVVNEEQRTTRGIMIAIGIILLVTLCLSTARCVYMGSTAGRDDVARAVGSLSPACRPVAQLRIRAELISGGRPISRRRLDALTSHIDHCDEIDAQMTGLADGMATQ